MVSSPSSPFSPRSLTPSPSPTQQARVVTPQPQQHIIHHTPQHPVLQLFHQQATRNTVQTSGAAIAQASLKAKQPPQILPKPPGSVASQLPTNVSKPTQTAASQPNTIPQQQGTLLLNQVLPNGAVLVQQQASSGVQLILKPQNHQQQQKQGIVLANGGLQPQAVIVQGRSQAHQVLRFVPGQMQLQQIQTSSGPTFIAVPSPAPASSPVSAAPRSTPPPSQQIPSPASVIQKKFKKKKKKEEEPRLDLANLIKISGIDEEDVSPSGIPATLGVLHGSQNFKSSQVNSTSPRPSTPKQLTGQPQHQQPQPQQLHQQSHLSLQSSKHIQQLQQTQPQHLNTSQLLTQLQAPSQVGNASGLRLSVGEDGTMVVHQAEQTSVTPSIAAAAQSQLAQLIAEHGGQIVQTNSGIANSASKEAAIMQSLQTAFLHLAGSGTDSVVLKGNLNQTPVMVNTGMRRASTSSVMMTPQNGVRLVADINGLQQQATSLTEHNRLIVSGITNVAPAVLEQNRVQIVTGVPTSTALSLEQQQNRLIVSGMSAPNTMLTQQQNRVIVSNVPDQGRVLVSGMAGSLEQQNRVQIVTSNSSAVSLTEQNRVIVSNVPNNVSLEQQNRLQILSSVPNSNMSLTEQNRVQIVSGVQNSLTEQQNRVIVSGVQSSNMSLEQQNRVQIVSGSQTASTMALEQQNRVQIVSGVQSSLTEEQNRVQIVSGVPNNNALSLSEQNRLHIVSNVPNANSLSLSEKQNLVHIVNSNLSLSEEQNRVQIVNSMPNVNVPLSEQSRVQIVNSIPSSTAISLSEPNRVQLLTSVPVSSTFSLTDHNNRVQIVTSSIVTPVSDTSRFQFSNVQSSLSEQNRLHIVSNCNTVSSTDLNRHHLVNSVPHTSSSVFNELQSSKVQIVSSLPNCAVTPGDQKHKVVTSGVREDQSNVQMVSALVSSSDKMVNSMTDPLTRSRESGGPVKFQQYLRPSDFRLMSQSVHNKEKEAIRLDEREDRKINVSSSSDTVSSEVPRVQFLSNNIDEPRIQVVGANNHTSVISQSTQIRTPVYPQEPSPKLSAKSPSQYRSNSPISSPPPTPFNNRPNLTVVTQPQRTHGGDQSPVINSVQNSLVKSEPTTPPSLSKTSQTNRRTYDNAFLDSIAQSHPSLVINKSPTPLSSPCAKINKVKKPVKKAALVKPMMAEDRTCQEKEEPPSLVPINVSNDHAMVPRVQTIQLTPQKQQQLKQIQAQVSALSSNKLRTASEQATLQRLIAEQRKILLAGKIVPTVPGQHAQGVAFVTSSVNSPVRLVPVPSGQRQTVPQSQVENQQTSTSPSQPTTHANKATSPIPIQQMSPLVQTQPVQSNQNQVPPLQQPQQPLPIQTTQVQRVPAPPPPAPPIFTRAKRAALIDEQMQADRQGAVNPDTQTPFVNKCDAVKRLIRYHTMNESVLSEKDLAKADELFEQTARHLLDKKTHMYNKYSYLILKESMRMHQTSELVFLERLFVSDETAFLEQMKQEAAAPPPPPPPPPSSMSSSDGLPSPTSSGVKREREEAESSHSVVDSKRHCRDDEEINAQVQSAINSILNLRSEPVVDQDSLCSGNS